MNATNLDLEKITIKEFLPKETSRELWNKFHQLEEELILEIQPKDSLLARETVEKDLMFNHSDFLFIRWLIFKDASENELIGWYFTKTPKEQAVFTSNLKVGYFEIFVKKNYRRRGLGTLILRKLAHEFDSLGFSKIETRTSYKSGFSFCEKLNGKLINLESENRLYFKDVDWDKINSWIQEGRGKNPDVEIESFYGASEEKIEEYCDLLTELEQEKPTLETKDEKTPTEIYTPNGYREFVQYMKEKSYTVYTIRPINVDGKIIGLTEIFFSKEKNPKRIEQGFTGIKSIYRGRGIGKWLKSIMLIYIKDNFPEADYFVTGNANHNVPMLAINTQLGFKSYFEKKSYIFSIEKLLSILKNK